MRLCLRCRGEACERRRGRCLRCIRSSARFDARGAVDWLREHSLNIAVRLIISHFRKALGSNPWNSNHRALKDLLQRKHGLAARLCLHNFVCGAVCLFLVVLLFSDRRLFVHSGRPLFQLHSEVFQGRIGFATFALQFNLLADTSLRRRSCQKEC